MRRPFNTQCTQPKPPAGFEHNAFDPTPNISGRSLNHRPWDSKGYSSFFVMHIIVLAGSTQVYGSNAVPFFLRGLFSAAWVSMIVVSFHKRGFLCCPPKVGRCDPCHIWPELGTLC